MDNIDEEIGSDESEFGWHWGVKLFVFISATPIALFGATASGGFTFQSLIAAGLIIVFFSLAEARFFMHRIVLTKEKIRNEGLFWTSTIRYEEISTLDLTDPFCLMKVVKESNWEETFLKVYPGIAGWRRLISELVERSSDKVEILDPHGRLRMVTGKKDKKD